MASRVQHIMRLSVQDWRTSKVRSRSAMTADGWLRTVYLEILFALYESAGVLPADPDALADVLMVPISEVERCIPILVALGKHGRGGIAMEGDRISNARVTEDLAEEERYRAEQAEFGRRRHQGSQRVATGNPTATLSPPTPSPSPTPTPPPKKDSAASAADPVSDSNSGFREAFETWKATLPQRERAQVLPTDGRMAKYRARRKKYQQATILAALRGYVNDPWPDRTLNASSRDMKTILRDDEQVEKFAAMDGQSKPTSLRQSGTDPERLAAYANVGTVINTEDLP